MKKVLFTATVDSHIIQFHIPYLKWFKEQGYEVHVATNGNEKIPYCDIKHKISFERNPIKINNIKAIFELKKIIEEEKFDIIHCHTPMGGVVTRLAAMKSRKKYNTKVIYTAHGFHFYKGAPLLNWMIYYPIEKILSNVTDCIITINNEDYDLAKRKFKMKQIELIHGVGVDSKKFKRNTISEMEKKELRKSIGINEKDYIIIYVAELSNRKNQQMLIKAMKLLEEDKRQRIKVLLLGKDSKNGKYQKMVKKLGLEKNILFLGYRNDVNKIMQIANLVVSTSKQEGLPVNIIEAMFIKLPIIATDCRGNRDLINTCVEINNYNQLKERIINEMEKKNQEIIEYEVELYKIENVIKNIEKIYRRNIRYE